MLSVMQLRRTLLVCIAISFAAIDLVHKSIATAEFHHARTPLVALMMFALIAALVVFVPRVPSNAAAIGACVACGGALGNLISLFAWAQGVPDPLIVTSGVHAVAFNLADLFALAGDALLLSAIAVYGLRNRGRLAEPAERVSLVQIFEIVDDDRLVLAPASHDFRDGEQEWQCDDSYHAGPRKCEPGDDESGHAEALPYRVVPQKPHKHDGFLHL